MITINTAPQLNKILLDANNSVISITSSNGVGHYFRAIITINDVYFDTQGWSRTNDYSAAKNIKKIYNAYFERVFNPIFASGITDIDNVKAKVNITIQERLLLNDSLVQTVDLQTFYILYNAKPALFSDDRKLQTLGVEPSILQIAENGKIAIPFLVNAEAEEVSVTLKDNHGNTINEVSQGIITGKKMLMYHFNLDNYPFQANTVSLSLVLKVGMQRLAKQIRLLILPDFPVKEIAFQNNFGFYQYAYFDGELSIVNNLDVATYFENDNTEKVFEINEEQIYTINTGSLLASEKELTNQVVNSLDAKLFINSQWIDLVTQTKKITHFKERQNNYSESLVFAVMKNNSIDNEFGSDTFVPSLIITSFTYISGNNYSIAFNSNFSFSVLYSSINPPSAWSTPSAFAGVTSPQTRVISIGGFSGKIRLKANYLGTDIYSNEVTL